MEDVRVLLCDRLLVGLLVLLAMQIQGLDLAVAIPHGDLVALRYPDPLRRVLWALPVVQDILRIGLNLRLPHRPILHCLLPADAR